MASGTKVGEDRQPCEVPSLPLEGGRTLSLCSGSCQSGTERVMRSRRLGHKLTHAVQFFGSWQDAIGEMRPLVAHCHHGLGRLYRAAKRAQAQEHLPAAAAMYGEMGMA